MCLSLNGILSAGERFSFGFSDSAHKPIDHFKKKKKVHGDEVGLRGFAPQRCLLSCVLPGWC